MTMTPGEIEHNVRQLDNDVHDIYTMLTGIVATQTRHGNRLDELQVLVGGTNDKVTELSARVDGIDGRLDRLDGRLDRVEAQLAGLTDSMAEVLRRLPS